MLKNLPKWYQIVSIDQTNAETLELRSAAIQSIVTTKGIDFFVDCIRLYLDKPQRSREFDNEFYLVINASDPMFLEGSATLEKRVLAGAVVYEYISQNNQNSLQIAMLLKAAIFGIAPKDIINIDIVEMALKYVNDEASDVRKVSIQVITAPKYPAMTADPQTAESLGTFIKSLNTYIKTIAGNTEKQNSAFQNRIETLEEESNIHWWLFRAFSNLKHLPVADLDPNEAPFVLGLEIMNLFNKMPLPENTNSFLDKILSQVSNLPQIFSIEQAVKSMGTGLSGEVINDFMQKYGNLTPLYFAFAKRMEADGNDAWKSIFENQAKISAGFECSTTEMAMQFLYESCFYRFQ
jgi:GTPase-associated system helical domain